MESQISKGCPKKSGGLVILYLKKNDFPGEPCVHEERQPRQGSVDGSGGGPEGGEQEVPPEPPPDQLRGGGPEGHERQGAPGPG